MALLAPPTPEIFDGLTTVEGRVRRMLQEQFAMYERGSVPLETGLREESAVPALAAFFANSRSMHDALVVEALSRSGFRSCQSKTRSRSLTFKSGSRLPTRDYPRTMLWRWSTAAWWQYSHSTLSGERKGDMARIRSSDEGAQR
jgi:hypothetical protein